MNVVSATTLLVPTRAGDRVVPLVLRCDLVTGVCTLTVFVPLSGGALLVLGVDVGGAAERGGEE